MVNTSGIIEKYYNKGSAIYNMLISHSTDVMNKAVTIAKNHPELSIDIEFVQEASMLHDIGIYLTHAPGIHCYGTLPYLCHGYLGHDILIKEGLPKHALVCERHSGVGLSIADIQALLLPIPLRDMNPQTIEEELICFSDCFFSKSKLGIEKSAEKVRTDILSYNSDEKVNKFDEWCIKFL